ncbi:methionine ABC transporter substrate-binding protein [Wohlfahrtiimonas chitiniclastica]|uniref:MetQ/NlpA family ABC transporter substrate-binding protein n=1 Tax=Wohlfahrtiimonas chitiniclastica TaxID=400946 RepID=UPI000B988ED7|nr:MetQ/NlpA family ABC transporter substrate-binding protein [Wohlfahrtiimonas chitiniclastica]OYQ71277.1 methionine ABC transporter substrate-binding protein [Wohlfahrtiimonas chitiniclastica]OYQ82873.1 methionine ABC transporter substrate-binding protein [Wohlfahrtiimonas chitiniclastica]
MHQIFKVTAAIVVMGLLAACGQGEKNNSPAIVVAFGPSTYSDQFIQGIMPIMTAKGHHIEPKVFSQNSQINRSMKDGEVHASIFQSEAFMKDTNRLTGSNMIKLADTASAPQTLRSKHHQSLSSIRDGMTITIPNDPVNAERAARILEKLGWVTIREGVEPIRFSVKDILPGQYTLNIKEIDPAQALRSLEDADFAVVNGNYIMSMGLKISDSLAIEETPDEHVVIVTIPAALKDEPWAKDLKAAYESDEFKAYILNEPLYDGFILPKAWQ